jgi:hypothetical protein
MSVAAAPESTRSPAQAAGARRVARFLADPPRAFCASVLALAAVVGLDSLGDPDAWWHLRVGQWTLASHHPALTEFFTYTAAGTPRVPQHWLSNIVFALVYSSGGLFLLALFMGAVCWTGFVAIALRGRALGAGPLAIAAGIALGAKAAEPVLGVRPQVFTFAFFCWMLWLVDSYLHHGGRKLWILPPLFLLWVNMHAGFVAALAVLGIIVVVEDVKQRRGLGEVIPAQRVRSLGVVTGLCAALACLNPVGPRIYAYFWTDSTTEAAKGIVEWQHPNFLDPGMWALAGLILGLGLLLALRPRADLREVVLAVAGCAGALLAVRNTSLCVAMAMPLWMSIVSQLSARAGLRMPRVAVTPKTVLAGSLVVAAGVGALGYATVRLAGSASASGIASVYPACAVDVLSRAPAAQRVYSEYFAAGYLVYRMWPHATVYLYGDSEAESLDLFQRYYRIATDARSSPTALQLLDSSNTTAVLYPAGALTAQLDSSPEWTRVLDDHGRLLYVRGHPSWTAGASCNA